MRFERIKARDKRITALDVLMNHFNSARFSGFTDAEWLSADSIFAVGATGLPFAAPICEKLMSIRMFFASSKAITIRIICLYF